MPTEEAWRDEQFSFGTEPECSTPGCGMRMQETSHEQVDGDRRFRLNFSCPNGHQRSAIKFIEVPDSRWP